MRFHYTVVCWHCAFAHRRGNTASESRDPYIENRCHKSIECEFQSSEQFAFENNFKRMIVNSGIWMSQVRRRLLELISSVKARAALNKQAFLKYNSYQIECFLNQSICIYKFPFENNFKPTKLLFSNGLIWVNLVCRELTGIMIAL